MRLLKKKVLIKVIGTQTNEEGQTDTIELVTPGLFYQKNNSYYIVYQETEISGISGVTTTIIAEADQVSINRIGGPGQKQIFKKGVFNVSYYATPYGVLEIGVLPTVVEVGLTDNGGSINLEYELQIAQEKMSFNKLQIIITPIDE